MGVLEGDLVVGCGVRGVGPTVGESVALVGARVGDVGARVGRLGGKVDGVGT